MSHDMGYMYDSCTYVRDIDVVLCHVEPDGDISKVKDRTYGVAVQNEPLDEAYQCESHVSGSEHISAQNPSDVRVAEQQLELTAVRLSLW